MLVLKFKPLSMVIVWGTGQHYNWKVDLEL